jgi:hypothetical protein
MRIDDAGRNDTSPGVNIFSRPRLFKAADLGDFAAANADIHAPARQTGTIDHIAVPHDQIVVHAHLQISRRPASVSKDDRVSQDVNALRYYEE